MGWIAGIERGPHSDKQVHACQVKAQQVHRHRSTTKQVDHRRGLAQRKSASRQNKTVHVKGYFTSQRDVGDLARKEVAENNAHRRNTGKVDLVRIESDGGGQIQALAGTAITAAACGDRDQIAKVEGHGEGKAQTQLKAKLIDRKRRDICQVEIKDHRKAGGNIVIDQFDLGVVVAGRSHISQAKSVLQQFLQLRKSHLGGAGIRNRTCNRCRRQADLTEQVEAHLVQQVVQAQADHRQVLIQHRGQAGFHVGQQVLGVRKRLAGHFYRIEQAQADQVEGRILLTQQEAGRKRRRRIAVYAQQPKDLALGILVVDECRVLDRLSGGGFRNLKQDGRAVGIRQDAESAAGGIRRNGAGAAARSILELVPGFSTAGQVTDYVRERQDLVLRAEAGDQPGVRDGQIGGVHRRAVYDIGLRRRPDKARRADLVQVLQQVIAAGRGVQNRKDLAGVLDAVEERVGGQQIFQRSDVLADEVNFARQPGVGNRRAVRIADRVARLEQLVGVVDQCAQEAAGRLQAEIVVEHAERRPSTLVGDPGLNQRVDRQQVVVGNVIGIGVALQVAARNQAASAVGNDIHPGRRRAGKRLPSRGRLVHPVSKVVESRVETVEGPVGDRQVCNIRQDTIVDSVRGDGDGCAPIPQRFVKRSVDAGVVGAVGVAGVDQRLDDVGVGIGQGFQDQLGRIDAAGQVPVLQRARERGIDKGSREPGDEQQRPVDHGFDAGSGHAAGDALLIDDGIGCPESAVEVDRDRSAGFDGQPVVARATDEAYWQREVIADMELVHAAAAGQDVHVAERDGGAASDGQAAARAAEFPGCGFVGGGQRDGRRRVADDIGDSGDVCAVVPARRAADGQAAVEVHLDDDRRRVICGTRKIQGGRCRRFAGNRNAGRSGLADHAWV